MSVYLVIVILTFWDGSWIENKPNDGGWETVSTYEECTARLKEVSEEWTIKYKDNDPKPSTFLNGCALKEKETE